MWHCGYRFNITRLDPRKTKSMMSLAPYPPPKSLRRTRILLSFLLLNTTDGHLIEIWKQGHCFLPRVLFHLHSLKPIDIKLDRLAIVYSFEDP